MISVSGVSKLFDEVHALDLIDLEIASIVHDYSDIMNYFNTSNLNRDDCFMIGDKDIDVLAAKNAKIRGFLFEGGNLSYRIKKILNIA